MVSRREDKRVGIYTVQSPLHSTCHNTNNTLYVGVFVQAHFGLWAAFTNPTLQLVFVTRLILVWHCMTLTSSSGMPKK